MIGSTFCLHLQIHFFSIKHDIFRQNLVKRARILPLNQTILRYFFVLVFSALQPQQNSKPQFLVSFLFNVYFTVLSFQCLLQMYQSLIEQAQHREFIFQNSPNIFVSDMTVLSIEKRTKCQIEIYSKERGEGR